MLGFRLDRFGEGASEFFDFKTIDFDKPFGDCKFFSIGFLEPILIFSLGLLFDKRLFSDICGGGLGVTIETEIQTIFWVGEDEDFIVYFGSGDITVIVGITAYSCSSATFLIISKLFTFKLLILANNASSPVSIVVGSYPC